MEALKIAEKIIREIKNAVEHKKNKDGLNLTPGYALIGLRTTGPRFVLQVVREEKILAH